VLILNTVIVSFVHHFLGQNSTLGIIYWLGSIIIYAHFVDSNKFLQRPESPPTYTFLISLMFLFTR
jgi:hypothetical protein